MTSWLGCPRKARISSDAFTIACYPAQSKSESYTGWGIMIVNYSCKRARSRTLSMRWDASSFQLLWNETLQACHRPVGGPYVSKTVQIWNTCGTLRDQTGPQACCSRDLTCILLEYTCHIKLLSKPCCLRDNVMPPAFVVICTCKWWLVVAASSLLLQ